MSTEIEGAHKSPSMEKEEDKDDFVLRSGVRAGLKREFAFAIASQAALAPSSSLGRTRTRSRTSSNSVAAPSPKRPRSRPPDPQPARDPTASPPGDPAAEAPVLALLAVTPKEELPVKPPDGDDVFFIPPESPPRRITRSMLKPPPPTPQLKLKPKPKQEEEEDHNDGQYQPGGVGGITRRRFTRSLLLKDKGGDDDLSGTTTASDSSSASPNSNKNMELKMSKKISLNKIPKNLRELLATGLLEGQPVKYIMRKGKRAVLRGIIKRIGILCSCSSCKGRNVVSPYYFEVHAGSTKKHPSDYIFLENGNNLHDISRACANATLDMLESAIQNAIGPEPQKRTFRCQTCKVHSELFAFEARTDEPCRRFSVYRPILFPPFLGRPISFALYLNACRKKAEGDTRMWIRQKAPELTGTDGSQQSSSGRLSRGAGPAPPCPTKRGSFFSGAPSVAELGI